MIAHGHDREIGNEQIGTIDITPATFIQLVQANMNAGQAPAAIYISMCEEEVAEFAAAVASLLPPGDRQNTEIYGHSKPMDGSVPSGKRAPVTELVRRSLTWTYSGEARPS